MGGLTSKHVDEVVSSSNVKDTPKRTHIISVDPRSPSDYISRTPIAVSNTPKSSNDMTPGNKKMVQTLATDPRSPTTEVDRTPIQIKAEEQMQAVSKRPSNLTQLETVPNVFDDESNNTPEYDQSDPRSPTDKFPRTPFEGKELKFIDSDTEEGLSEIEKLPSENEENVDTLADQKTQIEKKVIKMEGPEKMRRPLSSVQSTGTPRSILHAKQCRNLEEEYNKSQQVIMNQLTEHEKKVASSTQFVETI